MSEQTPMPDPMAPDPMALQRTTQRSRGSLFSVSLLAASLTAVTGMLVESLSDGRRAQAHEETADDGARERMLSFGWRPLTPPAQVHGVEILHARTGFELPLGHGVVSGTAATPEQLARASELVRGELAKLPTELFAAAQLRRVVLCGVLREDRRPIPSLPNYNRTLLLDADAEGEYLRRLLHHEIYHFVDLADDGSVLRDTEWEKLNPPGFRYGQGGRAMRGSEASVSPPPRGFVSGYATSALEEDKAEIFAELMFAPAAFRARAAEDTVLAAKAAHLSDSLSAFVPDMDRVLGSD